jgi:hypothetical protein
MSYTGSIVFLARVKKGATAKDERQRQNRLDRPRPADGESVRILGGNSRDDVLNLPSGAWLRPKPGAVAGRSRVLVGARFRYGPCWPWLLGATGASVECDLPCATVEHLLAWRARRLGCVTDSRGEADSCRARFSQRM